jgi:hypothetical protein
MIGGHWVSLALLIRCKCKTGKGSYLAWRNETAFGKDGQFPNLTRKQRRHSIRAWSRWAWHSRKA